MPSIVLCYAPEDAAIARRLAAYLEANLVYRVSCGECVTRPGFDLIDAAECALSAEVALVLLSPHSVPKVWSRPKWEPVFFQKPAEFGTLLGFVLLRDCQFPELLRRLRFFDATNDLPGQLRSIKRWLLRPDQPLVRDTELPAAAANLRELLGDRPGSAPDVDHATATSFATGCAGDFEAVYTIDCQGRTLAAILGGIGHLMQVKLAGAVQQNRPGLVERCHRHRYLFVLENARPEDRVFLTFGGLASVIFAVNTPARQRPDAQAIGAAFLALPRDEMACAALMGDAVICTAGLLHADFESALRLGWAVVSVLRAAERFAEAVEVLDMMEKAARGREDALALYRIEWEQSWLRETSPEEGVVRILPTAGPEIVQLSLPFT